MPRMSSGVGIVLAIGLGASITLWWLGRDTEPATTPPPSPSLSAAPSLPAPAAFDSPSGPESPAPAPAPEPGAAPALAPERAMPSFAVASDNSTYERMLAVAQTRPDEARAAQDITKWHERFMLTPDDPAWSRPTEQALSGFFQKGYSGRNFEVTSVACRAEGCEVQTLNTIPRFDGVNVVPPPSEEFRLEQRKVFDLTREPRPLGETGIRLDNVVITPVGDQMGTMLWYRRVPAAP